ncbi:acylphosphatase [Polaromonas sp.]|uniref:acylphosphatase n=1 Tax=Polaromonas sp. TaxID=1869339 RepID=UPI002FCA4C71
MAKHLRIAGLVQGIGYRAAFAAQAHALKLSGWVRNRLDGSVEATVAGDALALENIIDWAGHGPAGAQVRSVSVVEVDDALVTDGKFHIGPTA